MPTATASADLSTRRLSEVARHVVVPEGIVDTLWFQVEAQCHEWGDEFDVWQDGLGQLVLGLRDDGMFAATIGGVTLSIPRQVAKTFMVGRIVFALCALFPNLTVLWTAHRIRTASQTFEKLKGLARRPGVRRHMAEGISSGIRSANGEQEFHFRNGSRILFGAREQGFGRGFDEVDVEVFDEAQILTEKALEDMVAATNQSRFIHGALLFFMGTPPRPTDPGFEFANRRADALQSKPDGVVYAEAGDSMYVECSADPDVGLPGGPPLDDLEQVAIANPSYPQHTPLVSIKRLRKQLTSDDSWRREGLGVWPKRVAAERSPFESYWSGLVGDGPAEDVPPTAIAVDKWYDGTTAICGVWRDGDGAYHGELLASDFVHDNSGVVDWIVERAKKQRVPVGVAGDSEAAAMVGDLRARGVKVNALSVADQGKASVGLLADVVAGTFTHNDVELLTGAAMACRKSPIGKLGLWRPGRDSPESNITPIAALTWARFVASVTKVRTRTGDSVFR